MHVIRPAPAAMFRLYLSPTAKTTTH